RAQYFAEQLHLGIAMIHGEAQDGVLDQVDGFHSLQSVKNIVVIHPSLEAPLLIPIEKPPFTVVEDDGDRIAIIVDNIIDDVDRVKERGAISVMATHGIFGIPHKIQKLQCPKIKTVEISMILSEAIRCIHNIFWNIGMDD
uniref:Phosphoribosyl pyrophosphate synthase-associated protein 2 n=1 Tax=Erpetoichthys calabaricus TaxID=27687 RepID=A0A8C4SAV9_ERPCA